MSELSIPVQHNIAECVSYDPTESKTLRSDYSSEFYNRWRPIKGLINDSIIENDALRLQSASLQAKRELEPPEDFENSNNSKVEAFKNWFKKVAKKKFDLAKPKRIRQKRQQRPGEKPQPEQGIAPWIALFALYAMIKGIKFANSFFEPDVVEFPKAAANYKNSLREQYAEATLTHQQAIFKMIDDVTEAVTEELAQALREGDSRRTIASRINGIIDKIGIRRGRIIAATETMRTINNAALVVYKIAGVDKAQVQWNTREDDRVCYECRNLDGNVYPIDEAFGICPHHPRGRCYLVPV